MAEILRFYETEWDPSTDDFFRKLNAHEEVFLTLDIDINFYYQLEYLIIVSEESMMI